jgi:hypothetical protein
MVKLSHSAFVDDALEEMVVITGIPRSGTSIFGQLVGSFDPVEYAYEPPMVNYFDAMLRHKQMDPETVEDIFLPYLYFDHFASYLHGRGYSFREGDFSYILGMKTLPEILEQWNTVQGLGDAIERGPEYTFSFKYPGFYDLLSVLYDANPSIKVLDLGRNLDRIAASMYDKEWFSDQTLQPNSPGRWPYHETNGIQVPYLVAEEDVEWWQKMTPSTRTIYICNRFAEDRLAFINQYGNRNTYREVRYERLVESPDILCQETADFIDVKPGQKTSDVVDSVRSTSQPIDVEEILANCDQSVSDRFDELRPKLR